MIRVAICDDTLGFPEQIQESILHWDQRPTDMVIELFSDADALISAHASNPFHIIFLDVVMPLLNGIDAAAEIRQQDRVTKIVFLTSSPEFAVDSYSVKASNYLLKPLDHKKLHHCLQELTEDIQKNAASIPVRSRHAVHRVALHTIEYVEANNKEVIFYLADGQTIVSPEPLYVYEHQLMLSDGFFKCSRSYIVNIHLISTYTPKEIKMQSGCRIPISRNCRSEFESAYFSILFGKAGEL